MADLRMPLTHSINYRSGQMEQEYITFAGFQHTISEQP